MHLFSCASMLLFNTHLEFSTDTGFLFFLCCWFEKFVGIFIKHGRPNIFVDFTSYYLRLSNLSYGRFDWVFNFLERGEFGFYIAADLVF